MADVIRKVITGGQINLTVLPNNVAGTTSIGGSLAQKAFSPTATVTDTDDGVIITIIDVDGEHTATVRHGEKGDKGDTGEAGVSPSVSLTSTDSGVILTVNDGTGPHTALIPRGVDGEPGVSPKIENGYWYLWDVENQVYVNTEVPIYQPLTYDAEPTDGSDNMLTSGTVKAALDTKLDAADVPTKVSDLDNDAGYLTEHQDISGKADIDDIPTKVSDLDNDAGYLTTHQDISGKADVEDIPTRVSQLQNDSGYLTDHQDISGKADVEDIPTKVSQLQNDAGYLTQHQDISGKANVADVPTRVSQLENDSGYLTTHQDISTKADKSEIPTKVSQLQNDSGYLTTHQDISGKADKSEIPTKVSDLANDSGYLVANDIAGKANASDIPTKVSDLQNDAGYLTSHQDISGKADKSEIPTKVSDLQNDAGYLTQHQDISGKANVSDIPTKVSQLQNDSGYLTSHQDISGKIDEPATAGTNGQVLTSDGNGGASWEDPTGTITDVQVDGGSVVASGVANIPVASESASGTVKIGSGVSVLSDGKLRVNSAGSSSIKEGASSYFPIVPGHQHESVFYGLAKAAGDATQSASNNAVGTYTDDAKAAIRSMIGATNGNIVAVQDAQPTDSDVKVWINETAGTAVQVPTYTEMTSALAGKVDDIQIDGSSVVSNGIATIPFSSTQNAGCIKTAQWAGNAVNNDGCLYTVRAEESLIKAGTDYYRPIVPNTQQVSVFYGLAKAAGDTTQATSSNAVGTFTDEAKVAIQKMLGIYEAPWELINEETFTNTESGDHYIVTDSNGQAFELTDVLMLFELPQQETYAEKANYGQIWFFHRDSGTNFFASESGAWTQAANSAANGFMVLIEQNKGLIFCRETIRTSASNSSYWRTRYGANFSGTSQGLWVDSEPWYTSRIKIPGVTGTAHYKLYGKRRWQ